MQSLAFLWFELQMTKRYLEEKTFGPAPSPADSANLDTPIVAGKVRRASAEQTPRMAPAKPDLGTTGKEFLLPEHKVLRF